MNIPGLRSPYEKVGPLLYFGRMLDKIRLHAAGKLPADYVDFVGPNNPITTFDARCCRFLRIDYAALVEETKKGGSDETLLEWAFTKGHRPDAEEIEIWNAFLAKRGWRDDGTDRLHFRLKEGGFPLDAALTTFDYIDLDEGRPPRFPA